MKTEESKLKTHNEQLDIPVVMHSILTNAITDAYRRGYDDGYANIYNAEFVGEDQSKSLPIDGEESVVSELIKKYCA